MNWSSIGILLFIIIGSSIIASILFWSWRNGISPMPSSPKAMKAILLLLPKNLQGPIYELGSGWGTLAFALADKFPHCTVKAYETSWIPYFFSLARQKVIPRPNLYIFRRDFFEISLNDASVVVCYLYPGAMKKLEKKFDKELCKGCWVASNTFAIPGWKYVSVLELYDLYHSKVYLYKKA